MVAPRSIKGRFAKHVFPGETVVTEMWLEGSKVLYRCKVVERDAVVITNGVVEIEGGSAGASEDESKTGAGGKSAPLFGTMRAPGHAWRLAHKLTSATTSPESAEAMKTAIEADGANFVKQVKAVIVYKITDPDATWTVDLKNGSGSVTYGDTGAKADLTVTVSDADFVALANKELNPQQAFMRGKIKVKGNMGVAMKLGKVLDAANPSSKL